MLITKKVLTEITITINDDDKLKCAKFCTYNNSNWNYCKFFDKFIKGSYGAGHTRCQECIEEFGNGDN